MTQEQRAAELVKQWEHGTEEHRHWLRVTAVPMLAFALDEAEARGRAAGLEEAAQFCQDNSEDMCTGLPDTLATTFRNMKEKSPLGSVFTNEKGQKDDG